MNKKNNNKGFTLVELIVVLVILAILAAILVPALLGYIDRAKGQQIVLNARSAYTAAQAEMTSKYAKYKSGDISFSDTEKERITKTADNANCSVLTIGTDGAKTGSEHKNFTVTYVYYAEGDDVVVLKDGEWTNKKDVTTLPAAPSTTYEIIK